MPISRNPENSEHLYSARTTYIYRYHPTENRTASLKPENLGELKAWQKIERERRGKGGGGRKEFNVHSLDPPLPLFTATQSEFSSETLLFRGAYEMEE